MTASPFTQLIQEPSRLGLVIIILLKYAPAIFITGEAQKTI